MELEQFSSLKKRELNQMSYMTFYQNKDWHINSNDYEDYSMQKCTLDY